MKFNEFLSGKELIEKAKTYATLKHNGQKRKFGAGDYIQHPAAVAALVEKHGGTPEMIAAAWLHDVVEDCGVRPEVIKELYGPKVASLVDDLTNPPGVEDDDEKMKYIAKKITIMPSDSLTIKLCDRKNNTSDFAHADPSWSKKYADKTKFILDALEDSGRPLNNHQKQLVQEIRKLIAPYESN